LLGKIGERQLACKQRLLEDHWLQNQTLIAEALAWEAEGRTPSC
jgi:Cu+-exporting ATPase